MSARLLLIVLLLGELAVGATPLKTVPPIADWYGAGVDVNGYQELPGHKGVYGRPPGGDMAPFMDPFVYKSVVACEARDQAIYPMCAENLPECRAARDGQAIYWYKSLRGETPARWTFHSGPVCIYGEKPVDVLAEIAGRIQAEFKKTPVKGAVIGSQPGPHVLRGTNVNFYADASVQEFDVVLLGQKVHIKATPVSYTWNYGDGTAIGPSSVHGAALPPDRVGETTKTSHVYTATGNYQVGMVTHFSGTYSVNGGPQLPIPGQGEIPSTSIPIRVWRAETKNYADDCNVNPQGAGCG